jgi:hypothetical protein
MLTAKRCLPLSPFPLCSFSPLLTFCDSGLWTALAYRLLTIGYHSHTSTRPTLNSFFSGEARPKRQGNVQDVTEQYVICFGVTV